MMKIVNMNYSYKSLFMLLDLNYIIIHILLLTINPKNVNVKNVILLEQSYSKSPVNVSINIIHSANICSILQKILLKNSMKYYY